MKLVDGSSLAEELAHSFHEQQALLERARRAISLARAGGQASFEETVALLRVNRQRIVKSLGLLNPGQSSEDLFALIGYYLEVASRDEKEVLVELSRYVNVNEDLEALNRARQMAEEILGKLL